MNEILVVSGLFILRIGVPLMILLILGALVERSYNKQAR